LSGRYDFSASASVTISEFCKFLLSTFFFVGEWRKRRHEPVATEEDEEEEHELKQHDLEEDDAESSRASIRLSQEDYAGDLPWMRSTRKGAVLDFVEAVKDEVASEVRYGFAHLALFYVVMNNMVHGHGRTWRRGAMADGKADLHSLSVGGPRNDTANQVRDDINYGGGHDIDARHEDCGEPVDRHMHAGSLTGAPKEFERC
jgi:hypothetical protein